jgi:polysaccharide biosynthesis transport protein
MNDLMPFQDMAVAGSEAPGGHAENPLLAVHRHLRGRYRAALILGAILAVPLAIVGYFAVAPVYTSTGLVRVAPQIQTTIFDVKDAQVPPYFEAFVGTQASMINSRRVLDMAIADAGLRAAGWPDGDYGVSLLNKNLEVGSKRNTELIVATVKSKNPVLAQKALNAVLDAYDKVREESSAVSLSRKEQDLGERQKTLQTELNTAREQMNYLATKYATDDVDQLHVAKLGAIVNLDNRIQAIDLALAARSNTDGSPVAHVPTEIADLDLVLSDQIFASLKTQEQAVQTELDQMKRNLQPEHRQMKAMQTRYDAIHAEVEDRRQKLLAGPHGDKIVANADAMSGDDLKALRDRYVKQREAASSEAMELERAKTAFATFKDRIADAKQNLDETTRALDQIHTENRTLSAGHVSILQKGDLPLEPSTDRRKALAFAGALGGGVLGVGVVLLMGMVRGGFRHIDDLERAESTVPLLGSVPDLKSADAEHESMAALSVHHLRNILQLQFERSAGGKVFAITSAAAGDGKTSLSIALAMSFAATGRRTLIVDTDLVGRGLTRQLEMAGMPGLCDALRADKINGDIHATKVASLSAMPAGIVQGFIPEHLSSGTMGRIIKDLRNQYDAIILDTGPILGSLEANVVAPISDGVVVVVSRGQSARSVRASIQRLRRLGAPCSGLIFNRATTHDFDRSLSTASVSARSVRASAQAARRGGSEGRAALIRAVGAPAASDGREENAA